MKTLKNYKSSFFVIDNLHITSWEHYLSFILDNLIFLGYILDILSFSWEQFDTIHGFRAIQAIQKYLTHYSSSLCGLSLYVQNRAHLLCIYVIKSSPLKSSVLASNVKNRSEKGLLIKKIERKILFVQLIAISREHMWLELIFHQILWHFKSSEKRLWCMGSWPNQVKKYVFQN